MIIILFNYYDEKYKIQFIYWFIFILYLYAFLVWFRFGRRDKDKITPQTNENYEMNKEWQCNENNPIIVLKAIADLGNIHKYQFIFLFYSLFLFFFCFFVYLFNLKVYS